jgi:Na+-transporting NADH:ubiquinone oxidoreductase subunit NqrC
MKIYLTIGFLWIVSSFIWSANMVVFGFDFIKLFIIFMSLVCSILAFTLAYILRQFKKNN